jgi:glycine reductase
MRQPYRLTMHTVTIDEVVLGDHTGVSGSTLTVDVDDLRSMVLSDPRIADVRFEVAAPGDDARIVHCLDAVEPRAKVGDGGVFPGFLAGMDPVGEGETLRLAGVSVLSSSRYPQPFSGLLQAREAVVDMSGPSSAYSPFGRVINLVAVYTPNPEVENDDYDDAIRRATLAVAERLAASASVDDASDSTVWDFSQRHPDLPRVVYFYQLQSQGRMADTFLYGRDVHNLVPTIIHPTEVLDGAIVPEQSDHLGTGRPARGRSGFRRSDPQPRPQLHPGGQGAVVAMGGEARRVHGCRRRHPHRRGRRQLGDRHDARLPVHGAGRHQDDRRLVGGGRC